MTCELRIERTEGFRLSLTFAGPVELAAALAQVVARFEGSPVPEAPSRAVETAARTDDEARRRNAEKCKQWRRDRAANRSRTGREPVANRSDLGVAPASLSGSLPSLSPAFGSSAEIESENAREGEPNEPGREPVANRTNEVANPDPPDLSVPPWAPPILETLRMALGPPAAPIVLTEEWVGFVAHLGALRKSGSPRAICEAEWMGWLRRTWVKAREAAERAQARASPRPGGRLIQAPLPEQADRFDFSEEANAKRRAERARREAGT